MENRLERIADVMQTTYIKKDVKVRLSLLKGKNDPCPQNKVFDYSMTLNLVQVCACGIGIAAAGLFVYQCIKNSCEAKIMRKLAQKNRELLKKED
ncbi:MAG: hypothetical protein IJO74_02780 [Clostridia bacterium]|nr:hypothetical protein [Clostridia bacterium]